MAIHIFDSVDTRQTQVITETVSTGYLGLLASTAAAARRDERTSSREIYSRAREIYMRARRNGRSRSYGII